MNIPKMPFAPAEKTPRLFRNAVCTEKLDGTRATIFIDDSGELFCGSRTRWITPLADNYGFARWAEGNREELLKLGPGRHDGEWWGAGIQRRYGLAEKRFSLFNVGRWVPNSDDISVPGVCSVWQDPTGEPRMEEGPACCHVVPTIWRGTFDLFDCRSCLEILRSHGSFAAPGFMQPEGVVIHHSASRQNYKVTLDNDLVPKSTLS